MGPHFATRSGVCANAPAPSASAGAMVRGEGEVLTMESNNHSMPALAGTHWAQASGDAVFAGSVWFLMSLIASRSLIVDSASSVAPL